MQIAERGRAAASDPDNDWGASAAAAAAAQAAREAAQKNHDPMHRAAAGWGIVEKPLPASASLDKRAVADAQANAHTAMTRTDLPPEQAAQLRQVVAHLGNGLVDGRIDPHVNDTFRQHLYDVATKPAEDSDFRGALAQLSRAAQVLDRVTLASGSRLTYDPRFGQPEVTRSGLPILDVPEIDADLYFKTADGVVHIESVKATPDTFADQVDRSLASTSGRPSPLDRQSEWERSNGTPSRTLGLYALDPGPGFNHLMDDTRLAQLEKLVGKDADARRFVIGDRAYSINDFKQLNADIAVPAKAHVEAQLQKHLDDGHSKKSFKVGPAYNKYYTEHASSAEALMRTLGRPYGEAQPPLSRLAPADLPSVKHGGLFGAAASGGLTLLRVGGDGNFTLDDAKQVAGHTAFGAGTGALTAAGERAFTPVLDRAVGASVQRAATQTAGAVARTATVESTAAFGAGARTLVTRVGGATAVGAVIATGISAYQNREGLAKGDSKAIGNMAADTTVAVGSIAAATAAGAAVGSVVPVAGTAVGAVVGLAVGVGVAYGAEISGARDAVAKTVTGWVDGVKGWF